MIDIFLTMARPDFVRTCLKCGWQDIPDGQPDKLFCPVCDCDEFEGFDDEE